MVTLGTQRIRDSLIVAVSVIVPGWYDCKIETAIWQL